MTKNQNQIGCRLLCATLAATLVAGLRAEARGGTTEDLARWLDPDAAVAIRVDLDQIEESADLYRRSGLPRAPQVIFLLSAASTALLGFDVFLAHNWQTAGFDQSGPILGSFAAIDGNTTKRIYDNAGAPPANRVFWRNRIVLPVSNTSRADSSLRAIAKVLPETYTVSNPNAGLIGLILGATTKEEKNMMRTLQRKHILIVGRIPWLDQIVFAHRQGNIAIIDIVGLFGGQPLRWHNDRNDLLALLTRTPAGRGLTSRLTSGAGTRLKGPGTVVWINPTRLLIALEAYRQDGFLKLVRSGLLAPTALSSPPAVCADFRTITDSGPFSDLAMTTRIKPTRGSSGKQISFDLAWGLRGAYKLSSAFLIENDGLLDPKNAVTKNHAVAAGGLYLRSLQPLRSLPRPKLLRKSNREVWRSIALCGPGSATVLGLFGWPQLIGTILDDIASIHPQAEKLVASARNSVFAMKYASLHLRYIVTAFETSYEPIVTPIIEKYFEVLFGVKSNHENNLRSYATWGHGRIRPYKWRKPGIVVFGAGVNHTAVPWHLGLPLPQRPGNSKTIAELVARPSDLFKQLATSSGIIGETAKFLLPFVSLTQRFEGTLRVTGDLLQVSAIWYLR